MTSVLAVYFSVLLVSTQQPPTLPVEQHTMIVPSSVTIRNATGCPQAGLVSAEFAFDMTQEGVRVVGLSSALRTAGDGDKKAVNAMIRGLQTVQGIVIGCQADGSALVSIEGSLIKNGNSRIGSLTLRWGRQGAELLPSD